MGVLVSSAVPRLRCPEEANLRAPESVSRSISASSARRRPDRDEHLRREPAQARRALPRGRPRAINEAGVKIARDAREVSGRDVLIAGSIGPLGEVGSRDDERGAVFAEQARLLEGVGVDLFMVETFYELEELVDRDRGGPQRLVAPDRRRDDLRRGRADARRGDGGEAAQRSPVWTWPRSARTTAWACRRRYARSSRWAAAQAACRPTQRRPRQPRRPADRLPARDARVLRRVRRARAGARGAPDRRLLRHDADRDRRHPRSRRRAQDRAPPSSCASARSFSLRPRSRRRRSCSGSSRPASSSSPSRSTRHAAGTPRDARAGADAAGVGSRRRRRRERQPDGRGRG